MAIQFEGPLVVRELKEARKRGDKKKIEELERVLGNIMASHPASDSPFDPEEEACLGEA